MNISKLCKSNDNSCLKKDVYLYVEVMWEAMVQLLELSEVVMDVREFRISDANMIYCGNADN